MKSVVPMLNVVIISGCLALSLPVALNAQVAPGVGKFRIFSGKPAIGRSIPVPPTPQDILVTPSESTVFEALEGVATNGQAFTVEYKPALDGNDKPINPISYGISNVNIAGDPTGEFTLDTCPQAVLDFYTPKCVYIISFKSAVARRFDASLSITLTPSNGRAATTVAIPLKGIAYAQCTSFRDFPDFSKFSRRSFLPLAGKGDDVVNCFYNTSSSLAAVTQAIYQYNPAGSASTLRADLISAQFSEGFQVSLTAAASTSSCDQPGTTTSNPTNTACSGATPSASNVSQASLAQDAQQLEQGGDFGLKLVWPIFHFAKPKLQISNFVTPTVGFTESGLSSTVTATTGTAVNSFTSDETYIQLFSIPAAPGQPPIASVFFDHRWGLESADPGFVQNAALAHHNFVLQEFSAGIIFNSTIKISGERYWGANQKLFVNGSGSPIPVNNFNNWSLSVQFVPAPKS